MKKIPLEDLEYIFQNTKDIWEQLRGKTIFLTGGTGFFGKWLLESFIYVNEKICLNANIISLSRNPELFIQEFPFYNENKKSVKFVKGDILTYDFKFDEEIQFIIHAATAASDSLNKNNPLLMMDTITLGTRNVLDFALTQPIEGFLFVSSGAVYGKQPINVTNIKETDSFKIDINHSNAAYSEGKRIAELYCSTYFETYNLPVKIARCFAFVGPYLPLETHFAIGNFINNVIKNEDIVIMGDGSTIRSYMYASDLSIAIWKILLIGDNNKPYNVGVDTAYSLKDIAIMFKKNYGNDVKIMNLYKDLPKSLYVPNIDALKNELGIKDFVQIEEAIQKTIEFNIINEQ
jgi:nucleoside-diphosphate-sugar epimerase